MQDKELSILYIHHYGKFGGASKSLFELVRLLKKNTSIRGHIVTQRGVVPKRFEELGFTTTTTTGISVFDHTTFGYYHGLRWLVLIRELYYLPFTILALIKVRKCNPDLIHVNEITMLPAIVIAKLLLRKPLIVHARVVLKTEGFRYRMFQSILSKFSDHIIAIDKSVHLTIPKSVPSSIIHNGIQMNTSQSSIEYRNGNQLKVALVGGLVYAKGVLDYIEAARITNERGHNVLFIIVGESPTNFNSLHGKISKALGLTKDIKTIVNNFVDEHRLQQVIDIREFTLDVSSIYEEIDLLCFPNHANASGRPVFEAAFFGKPSISSERADVKDGIVHQETGLCVDSKNPNQLADAIEYFYLNRNELTRMGQNALLHATQNFDIEQNAKKVSALYEKISKKSASVNSGNSTNKK